MSRRGGIIGSGIAGGAGIFTGQLVMWNGSQWTSGVLSSNYVSFSPVNGANSLNATQSNALCLNLTSGLTGVATLTSATPAAQKQLVLIRNGTGQSINFQFATGTAVTVANNTSAWITSDGANAILMMVGT